MGSLTDFFDTPTIVFTLIVAGIVVVALVVLLLIIFIANRYKEIRGWDKATIIVLTFLIGVMFVLFTIAYRIYKLKTGFYRGAFVYTDTRKPNSRFIFFFGEDEAYKLYPVRNYSFLIMGKTLIYLAMGFLLSLVLIGVFLIFYKKSESGDHNVELIYNNVFGIVFIVLLLVMIIASQFIPSNNQDKAKIHDASDNNDTGINRSLSVNLTRLAFAFIVGYGIFNIIFNVFRTKGLTDMSLELNQVKSKMVATALVFTLIILIILLFIVGIIMVYINGSVPVTSYTTFKTSKSFISLEGKILTINPDNADKIKVIINGLDPLTISNTDLLRAVFDNDVLNNQALKDSITSSKLQNALSTPITAPAAISSSLSGYKDLVSAPSLEFGLVVGIASVVLVALVVWMIISLVKLNRERKAFSIL